MDEKSALLIKKFLPMKNLLLSLAAALCCIATINAQVAVTCGGGSWGSEVSWEIVDADGAIALSEKRFLSNFKNYGTFTCDNQIIRSSFT